MSLSAENRNQMPIPIRRFQSCSLCRERGHNITTCNSDRLLEFEVICANAVRNFENTDDFKNWLMHNYINDQLLLKAFAIRKYRLTTSCNLEQYIHFITEYIFRTYKNIPQTTLQPATILQPDTILQPSTTLQLATILQPDTLPPLDSELVNHYEREFTNLLMIVRNRNIVREQILDQQIAEVDMMRMYMSYLSYLSSLIVRDEYQIQIPQNQRRTTNLTLTVETDSEENLDENCQCSICWDDKERRQFVKLDCTHEFCKDCIKRTIESRNNLCCALCRSELRTITLRRQEIRDEIAEIMD
jgi:hypothetical protein